MTKADYKNQRKQLADEAQAFINEGKLEDANEKMEEIRGLDSRFENEATAQANLEALNGAAVKPIVNNITNLFDDSKMEGEKNVTDMYATKEYREAFMNFVLKGKAIPAKFVNQNAATTSGDTVTVPTQIYDSIFFALENVGAIYARVFKTSYPAALVIPVSSVKPVATWVDEDAGADRQKHEDTKIQFAGYKLDCKMAFSLFITTTTLERFESQFAEVITEAMVKSLEGKILNGSGSGCPKGILKESTTKVVNIAADAGITYQTFIDTEAELPAAYDGPDTVYLMTKKTFMKYYGIVDDNGQPIARINQGLDNKPTYNILGRTVIPTDGYMDNYASSVTADTTVAAIFNLKHYIFNLVLGLQIKRYVDDDTDQTVIKGVILGDGKAIDTGSLVKVVKKAPAQLGG